MAVKKSELYSMFIDACIRKGIRGRVRNPWRIILSVIVLGLLSNVSENLSDTFKTHENVPVTNR